MLEMSSLKPIDFKENKLYLLDQRLLPLEENYVEIETIEQTHEAIKQMIVRGAPCIGFTAIYGMAFAVLQTKKFNFEKIEEKGAYLASSRPTAVNLKFEIQKVLNFLKILARENDDPIFLFKKIVELGDKEIKLSEARNRNMATVAREELRSNLGKDKYKILTHCNTGHLACGSLGTALGVIEHLADCGEIETVWVDETRPYLQGSRLTYYELSKLDIEHQIVTEGAASYLMSHGLVDAIFTGADRVVANGDTANKIGTANVAILANHFQIPFYIVAPQSTFDFESEHGNQIDIELRDPEEILKYNGQQIAPYSAKAFNPSFDVTPGELISGIINEHGIAKGDYKSSLGEICHYD